MAHGGHCGGSHAHHHHHHSYSGSGSNSSTLKTILLIVVLLSIPVFISKLTESAISGKTPLPGKYSTYQPYLIDENQYFSNHENLIAGLQYLHEHTNVQIVVMSSNDSWSDSKAVERYHKMFNDEAHILIIVPTSWFSSTTYYAIGDLANDVIDDEAIHYLLENIDCSSNGKTWEEYLRDFSDTLLL